MLKILVPTLMLIPTIWFSSPKWLWTTSAVHGFLIATLSLSWMNNCSMTGYTAVSRLFAIDNLSTPLLVLSCWLLPLMILASQNHTKGEPIRRQRLFISVIVALQVFLILAFSANELIMFYLMFEATLIPTLILITRWGSQAARLASGDYFLLYTLFGSLPLLVVLLALAEKGGTLSLITPHLTDSVNYITLTHKLWWLGAMLAFFVKMPLYGVHLWLPKAHVEAPIAGSMVLAAVLLKLGGYGMIRMLPFLEPISKHMVYPFILMALWGVVMTSSVCLRQADLKSLIAYSSVSHMGLVIGAILLQTPWGMAGATALMIAHGLTSSALFCLANTNYERTHSRVMVLARGLQVFLPLMGTWWLFASVANLGLPPLPNLMGELLIITSLFAWSPWTILFTGLGTLITAAYSLNMYLVTQRGAAPEHLEKLSPSHTREHFLILLHLAPLLLLMLKPELIWGLAF
uniref:NADH-ubiquinone oxidoreductase chain 4 n=1 Tax=Bothus myriaster TaxID=366894 RepID=A0A3G0Z989_BOTMY|nr:NADH dehydrogenase subunit 4 [Bothus myriaster]AID59804.1 NADH dehydrogenase subunit 4 [Bothus myriaster]